MFLLVIFKQLYFSSLLDYAVTDIFNFKTCIRIHQTVLFPGKEFKSC